MERRSSSDRQSKARRSPHTSAASYTAKATPKRKERGFEIEWNGLDLLLLSAIGLLVVVILSMFFPQFHSLRWYWIRAVWCWRTLPSMQVGLPTAFLAGLIVLLWIRARRR